MAIADLSPGIVRFYFDSKAAMLVASLEYLAAEFEDRVLLPVSQLRHAPVAALELLVDLYLDPQIASPRKVSVWYSFWGEASSRQEYYDICGRKDEDFAALVHELIERLIAQTGAAHLACRGQGICRSAVAARRAVSGDVGASVGEQHQDRRQREQEERGQSRADDQG